MINICCTVDFARLLVHVYIYLSVRDHWFFFSTFMRKVFSYLSWFVANYLILISSIAGKLVIPVVNIQLINMDIKQLWTFLFMSFKYKIVYNYKEWTKKNPLILAINIYTINIINSKFDYHYTKSVPLLSWGMRIV